MMLIRSLHDVPFCNAARVISLCASSAAAGRAMFESGGSGGGESLKQIVVDRNDDRPCAQFQSQECVPGFVEGLQVNVLDDGETGLLGGFVHSSVAENGREPVEIAGFDNVRPFLNTHGDGPVTATFEREIIGAQSSHANSCRVSRENRTIAEGGAVTSPVVNSRDRAAGGR